MNISIFTKNCYRGIMVTMCLLCILIFLTTENLIPSIFKYLTFVALIFISMYFMPFSLIKPSDNSNKALTISSKIIFGIKSAFLAVISLISTEEILVAGKILIIFSSIFSIAILFVKNDKYKSMFVSHSLIIFFLIGLTKMLN